MKQAGALPAAFAVPWRQRRGHDIAALDPGSIFRNVGKTEGLSRTPGGWLQYNGSFGFRQPFFDKFEIIKNHKEAAEIRELCEKEISIQDRHEYHKAYYIKNPDKYNQKGKKNEENSEV